MTRKVVLSVAEILNAANVGVMRQANALKRGLRDAHGLASENAWSVHIEGACGELAFCKAYGCHWSGGYLLDSGNTKPDVGNFEVRTRRNHHDKLIVRPRTPDDRVCVLVTGCSQDRVYIVRGWICAGDARSHTEWKEAPGNRPAAWFVPQEALHDMAEALDGWFDTADPVLELATDRTKARNDDVSAHQVANA